LELSQTASKTSVLQHELVDFVREMLPGVEVKLDVGFRGTWSQFCATLAPFLTSGSQGYKLPTSVFCPRFAARARASAIRQRRILIFS
jgi:hypothetical protein